MVNPSHSKAQNSYVASISGDAATNDHTIGFAVHDDDAASEMSFTHLVEDTRLSNRNNVNHGSDVAGYLDLSKFKASFETNHWSDNNELWRKCVVPNPRLPTIDDSAVPWDVLNYPHTIDGFVGKQNEETKNSLHTLVANGTMRNVIIHGPAGCGKSAMVQVFLKEFYKSNIEDGRIGPKDCVYQTTGEVVVSNVRKFIHDVEHWKKKLDHKIKKTEAQPPFKAVVIDSVDDIPSGKQQNVRMLVESMDDDGVRFVFTCGTPKTLVDGIRQRAYILPLKLLPQFDMLQIALATCIRESIGFEKDGIEELFKYTGNDLGKIFRTLQDIFTKHAYLSYENVLKEVNPKEFNKPITVDPIAAIEPIKRCEKCTLVPPCRHISIFDLAQLGRERRRSLPKRGEGSMTCTHFAATGCCPIFNKLGRCSCNHPLDIHTIHYPPVRCAICSLPKPCGKCEYTRSRANLQNFVREKKELLVSYKSKKLLEVLELANQKMRGGQASAQSVEKINGRTARCSAGLETLAVQLEQIEEWLGHSENCVDDGIYKKKQKWISKSTEAAFYAVDRALYEWRSRRDRDGSSTQEDSRRVQRKRNNR